MVHKYKDLKTGKVKNLTTKESDDFDYLIGAIGAEDTEEFENTLSNTPKLAYAIEEDTETTALGFAILHTNAVGLKFVEFLLQYGADALYQCKRKITVLDQINAIKGPYKQKFLDLAYKYAKTFDEKMAIDPLRVSAEYAEETKDSAATVNNILYSHKQAKKDGCIICKVEVRYDNELLNHPKIQQIMAVASSLKAVDQLLDLTTDKEVASSLLSAIDEKYEAEIAALLADGADPLVIESISNAIYSMKVEEVLSVIFSKPEATETTSATNAVDYLVTPVEAEKLQSSAKGLFGYIGDAVETMSKYVNALLEQNINGKILENSIKTLEILLYFAQASGGVTFVGGFHGGNGDDFGGNGHGGGSGVVFKEPSNPTADAYKEIALPANTTIVGSFVNYEVEAY